MPEVERRIAAALEQLAGELCDFNLKHAARRQPKPIAVLSPGEYTPAKVSALTEAGYCVVIADPDNVKVCAVQTVGAFTADDVKFLRAAADAEDARRDAMERDDEAVTFDHMACAKLFRSLADRIEATL